MKTIKWLIRIIKENFIKYTYGKQKCSNKNNSIITFNIRRDSPNDGENNWVYRRDSIIKMIEDKKPGIICVQECMPHMWKYLCSKLPDYNEYSVDTFSKKSLLKSKLFISEGLGILYDSNKYTYIASGFIRLHKGFGFDTKYWRIGQHICLFDKSTQKYLYVFNTHLEHKTRDARYKACESIHNKIQEIENIPIYICGDFNAEPEWLNNLGPLTKNYKVSTDKCINREVGTIHNYGTRIDGVNIDFCYYKGIEIKSSEIITDGYGVKYLSDHNPVIIEIDETL